MYLKSIVLQNIGPYMNTHSFDFAITDEQNIILIGGNNGSGKTTLLNAIKVGLFGSHAYGYTTNSEGYIKQIKSFLNKSKLNNEKAKFQIKVVYESVENYDKNVYEIDRHWQLKNNKVLENVIIKKNNTFLKPSEQEKFINETKIKMTPDLIESILFDGENIATIIEENKISSYLKTLFINSFNFEIFTSLSQDIMQYIEQEKKNASLTAEEIEALDQKNLVENLKNEIRRLEISIEERILQAKEKKATVDAKIVVYRNLGGLSKQAISDIKGKLDKHGKSKQVEYDRLKDFFENEFLFKINESLLNDALKSMKTYYPTIVADEINALNNMDIIDADDLYKLQNLLNKYIKADNAIHKDINKLTISNIESLIAHINKKNISDYINGLNNTNGNVIDDELHKKYIENNQFSTEFESMITEITELQNEINSIKNAVHELSSRLDSKKDEFNDEFDKLSKLEKEIFRSNKKQNSFIIANKIMKTSEAYVKVQTEKLLSTIEVQAQINFKSVINKTKFIKKIKIDVNTFDIKLYDYSNKKHSINILSAGEKQIMMASIINAVLTLSRRRMPSVYDTPLARLDRKNRINFVKKIIKNSSRQVIILSTDEEIIGDTLKAISSNVSKTYLLTPESSNKTTVSNDYFEKGIDNYETKNI